MTEIPNWHITGDWFDNCSCAVTCPCTFAQAPDNGFCESVSSGTSVPVITAISISTILALSEWDDGKGIYGQEGLRGSPACSSTNALMSAKRRCFPAFLAAVQEDFRDSLRRCSLKAGSPVVWSGHGSPSRSRPTALNGE
jgi:hypothetical protein